jgi:CHAT domain-containing protein
MKTFLFGFFLSLFLLTVYAVGQSAQRTGSGTKEAIAKGKVTETLSQLEAEALAAEKNNHWDKASSSYLAASRAARISGQLQKAILYGNKAVEMGEKARDSGLQAQAILQLSKALGQLGQHAKKREWLEKGIEIAKLIPLGLFKENIQANLYKDLGHDFLRSGETQKAVEYLAYSLQAQESRLSFAKRQRRGNPQRVQKVEVEVVNVVERLGDAYRSAGNTEEAIKTYEKGLGMIKESGMKTRVEGSFYQGLGQTYLGKKDFPRAQENLNKALEIAERLQDAHVIQQASSHIGDLLRQTNRPSEAVPYYKKAIDTIESSRSLLESEEFRSSFFEDKRQTYDGIILAYMGDNKSEDAFNYNERARSRAFLDILGSKVQLAHGALLEEERALQARISALQAGLKEVEEEENEEEDIPRRRNPEQELEQAQKAYNDFLAKVRKENKEQASLMNVEPLTLKQTQELLEPGVTMLEYFVTRQAVLLWVVEKDRLQFVNIRLGRKDLVSKVGTLRESVLKLGEKEKFRASSQELYKLLIEPSLQHIRGKELLIVPHDVLHYLPFQALVSRQGKYLIQDYPVYYLSSASLMQFTKEKKRAGGERALVMGNPNLGDEAYNLRFAEREAKEVASVYPQSAVYLRADASKPRVVSLSPNFDMLHFAVHAEFNEEDPMSSALLLAPEGSGDGKLRVGEIFSLDLKTNMVVLSACETGLGKLSSGDEIVGLTRAFIYAGTPSIVTTLWKVNDRASYELMREFYQHLKTAKKSEALRQAQLKTMEQFPEPFYWAAYQLTGEP